jgi:hypothetical protein
LKNNITKYLKPALTFLAAVFLFAYKGNAQANHHKSIISTKMVVLTYKHNDSSSLQDHTDTLNIPVVSDKYPGLKKALSFENIGDADGLQGVINNYASCSCGLTSLNYEVVFESNDILSIKIFTEGMGAYPSSSTQRLTLNIHTGATYPLSKEINAAGRKWIYDSYKKLLKKRIADDYKARKGEEDKYNLAQLNGSVDSLTNSEMLKSYLFTPAGIMFSTEGVLPHVVQALEPNREWFVPYSRLRKYKMPHAIVVK